MSIDESGAGSSRENASSGNVSPSPNDIAEDTEQELQEVAKNVMEAGRIIVLVGAGISTNCGIPISIVLYFLSPLVNNNPGLSVGKWPPQDKQRRL